MFTAGSECCFPVYLGIYITRRLSVSNLLPVAEFTLPALVFMVLLITLCFLFVYFSCSSTEICYLCVQVSVNIFTIKMKSFYFASGAA